MRSTSWATSHMSSTVLLAAQHNDDSLAPGYFWVQDAEPPHAILHALPCRYDEDVVAQLIVGVEMIVGRYLRVLGWARHEDAHTWSSMALGHDGQDDVGLILYCGHRYIAQLRAWVDRCLRPPTVFWVDYDNRHPMGYPVLTAFRRMLYAMHLAWDCWRTCRRVIVACDAGRHRSVTVAAWLLVGVLRFTPDTAKECVLQSRNAILRTARCTRRLAQGSHFLPSICQCSSLCGRLGPLACRGQSCGCARGSRMITFS